MIADIKKCRECNDPVTEPYEGDSNRCMPCARAYQLSQYYRRMDRVKPPTTRDISNRKERRGPTLEKRANIDSGLRRLCAKQKPNQIFTLTAIAKECGCTKERIRQLQVDALKSVRELLARGEILGMRDLPADQDHFECHEIHRRQIH